MWNGTLSISERACKTKTNRELSKKSKATSPTAQTKHRRIDIAGCFSLHLFKYYISQSHCQCIDHNIIHVKLCARIVMVNVGLSFNHHFVRLVCICRRCFFFLSLSLGLFFFTLHFFTICTRPVCNVKTYYSNQIWFMLPFKCSMKYIELHVQSFDMMNDIHWKLYHKIEPTDISN